MKSKLKHLLVAASVISFYLIVWVYLDIQRYFTFDALKQHQEVLLGFVRERYGAAVAIYLVVTVAHGACALPATSLLIIASGFLFGWVPGMFYAAIGMLIGGCAAFCITRYLFGYAFYRKYHHQLEQFRERIAEHYISYLVMMRVVPVIPFFLANILSGLALVPIGTFIWTLLVGIAPSIAIYAFLGTELGCMNQASDLFTWRIMALFVALSLLTIIPLLHNRQREGKKDRI